MIKADVIKEPSLNDFEDGAILNRNNAGIVTKVTSPDGKRVLWPITASVPISAPNMQVENNLVLLATTPDTTNKTDKPRDKGSGHRLSGSVIDSIKRLRTEGLGTAAIARTLGVSKSSVKVYAPSGHGSTIGNADANDTTPDFLGVENTPNAMSAIPYSIQIALQLILDTAGHQAILGEGTVKAFFEGYISGANSALGVICGAYSLDLSFLKEEEKERGGNNDNK